MRVDRGGQRRVTPPRGTKSAPVVAAPAGGPVHRAPPKAVPRGRPGTGAARVATRGGRWRRRPPSSSAMLGPCRRSQSRMEKPPDRQAPAAGAGGRAEAYTLGMKTAISHPDTVFRDAERLAKQRKKSRCRLYTEAVLEYVARHELEAATKALLGRPSRLQRPGARMPTPGSHRPGRRVHRSQIATVVCIPVTSNLKWAEAPGKVSLPKKSTGLSKDSVANVSQVVMLDRSVLTERAGRASEKQIDRAFAGLDIVLAS